MRKFKQFFNNLSPFTQEYIEWSVALLVIMVVCITSVIPLILSFYFEKWQYLLLYLIIIPIVGPIIIMSSRRGW